MSDGRAPTQSTEEAYLEAQRIAFGPITFQATRLLRDLGILEAVRRGRTKGVTFEEIVERVDVSRYGVRVLVDAGLGIGLFSREGEHFVLTKTGLLMLRDRVTRTNMDFVGDCCYEPAIHLGESIREGRPAGLSVFGEWDTLYEGLTQLPSPARESWFAFDHLYSDSAFPAALPLVFRSRPRTLLDIGGNTGRWSFRCADYSDDVSITILDKPAMLAEARENIAARGLAHRVATAEIDLLDRDQPLPSGFDVLWMSQLLVCFSEEDAASIVRRAADAMGPDSTLYILDTCWDQQKSEAPSFSLQATSLYFTFLANGCSREYTSVDVEGFVDAAGLVVAERTDGLGICHSLFECRRP